jgi:hypothetical protein
MRPALITPVQTIPNPGKFFRRNAVAMVLYDHIDVFTPLKGLDVDPSAAQMRARLGRPHWMILDEPHHLLPAEWLPPEGMLPDELTSMVLITVHLDLLSTAILERLNTLLAIGPEAADILQHFAKREKRRYRHGTANILLWEKCCTGREQAKLRRKS